MVKSEELISEDRLASLVSVPVELLECLHYLIETADSKLSQILGLSYQLHLIRGLFLDQLNLQKDGLTEGVTTGSEKAEGHVQCLVRSCVLEVERNYDFEVLH